jgi:ribose transport system ATP-binding protein
MANARKLSKGESLSVPETETVLSMEGITKSFLGVPVLKGVDFDLRRGEAHVLLGENGAGKSTLMKILSGAYSRDSGTIRIGGVRLGANSPRAAEDAGIVSIYQNFHLFPHLSVAENLAISRFAREAKLIRWKDTFAHAKGALDRIDFNVDLRAKVGDLPVAQKQMLEIALALSKNAKILIMDEPTAALSSRETETLFRTIADLKKRGVGVIYISHRLEEIKQIGDRVTVLRDGVNVGTLPVSGVDLSTIIRLMIGRDLRAAAREAQAGEGGRGIVEIRNLTCPGAFRDVSLTLSEGQVLGLTGLVGAGKTEVAQALFGVREPSEGRILVDGKEVSIESPRTANLLGLGYLPEDRDARGLCLNMGVQQNITLASLSQRAYGFINPRSERRTAESAVNSLNIRTPSLAQQVKFLSGGNKQKVMFAKWLAARCRVLILDEPTFGVDAGARAEIYALIDDFAHAQKKAVLFTSSDIDEALAVTDRILVMAGGSLIAERSPRETTKQEILGICMQGPRSREG